MFPKWTNSIRVFIAVLAVILPVYTALLVAYGVSPGATDVGYQPVQPVSFSHALHAGELGMDCRYCHTAVEDSRQATLPPTNVCMNCHATILGQSKKLSPVRQSYTTGMPVEWVRVHDLPDFAYFDHGAHVRSGIGCVSCHGDVDTMDEAGVYQIEPLSMGWCLDCHRQPERHLRPVGEVTNMQFTAPDGDQMLLGKKLRHELHLDPSTDCSSCHR